MDVANTYYIYILPIFEMTKVSGWFGLKWTKMPYIEKNGNWLFWILKENSIRSLFMITNQQKW